MIKNKYEGKFIVFEGLDGSGQSTQAKLLFDYLNNEKNIETILTKEPTIDSDAGKKVREILSQKTKADPTDLQKYFAQDRYEHLENVIIPALAKDKFVISDRYFFSSFAFGNSDGLDLEWLIRLNDGYFYPDLTILLKVSPEVCVKRIEARGTSQDLFEKQEKLAKVWETYAILPERFENILMIDGEREIEVIFEEVKHIVEDKILSKIIKAPKLR